MALTEDLCVQDNEYYEPTDQLGFSLDSHMTEKQKQADLLTRQLLQLNPISEWMSFDREMEVRHLLVDLSS